ncbi:MAG: hypothetical protein U0930_21625 [Pirellulales bacterium]
MTIETRFRLEKVSGQVQNSPRFYELKPELSKLDDPSFKKKLAGTRSGCDFF